MAETIELTYTNGILTGIAMPFKHPLSKIQYEALFVNLAQAEADIHHVERIGLRVTVPLAPNQKLAMFCAIYYEVKGLKYKVSAADAGKIKLVDFDAPLLRFYLKSDNFLFKGKQSVSNLVRYINELKAAFTAGPPAPKSPHPDHYSPQYEKTLTGKATSDYWQHLRSLGLVPKKDRFGNTTDWIKGPGG
jgi:hypothetical protein